MSDSPSNVFAEGLRSALVAMVKRRVPESEVEDIVQATLADALASPHAPKDSESLRRWIFGVARNKVVDYHRRAGRETFELPEVPGKPAPHAEADLLRWAEKHLPPGEENETTLDWMLREGEGEKLEWIAESERVPATRVRQRVSRLRRHLKTHWQREVALLAALGVIVGILALVLRRKEPASIANEDVPRAAELREAGLDRCAASDWRACLEKLDAAGKLDPAGDARPEVRKARDDARRALSTPPPTPTTSDVISPAPTSSALAPPTPEPPRKLAPPRSAPTAAPAPTPAPSGEPMTKRKSASGPDVDVDPWRR
jgi:RNA polymerase sigma factor (sigma-70 family)